MANNFYPCISIADLKTINGADLNNNDIALVATSDSAAVYYLSATSGATESLPTIVAPTSNAGAKRWLMTLSTGWEGGMLKIVTQTAHGFVVGDVLYNNAGTYEKAIATSEPTAEVIGIVSSVLDANHFYLLGCGYITGLSGLTAGTVYFLSTTVAGATQATEPTADGEISKPILIADSTTTAYFVNMRGVEIGDTTSLFVSDEAYGATWDNETTIAPSQNAVYDKIESIGGALVSDTAYAGSWDGVTDVAPSKNAVYDKLETAASETIKGMVELATNAETIAMADTGRVVTPDDLGYFIKRVPAYMGIVSTADYESASLGAELLSGSGWTSTGWTGDFASGFDHNTGNTTALLNSLAAVINDYYLITYTVTGRSAGTFTITFGGVTSEAFSATGTWGPKATSTGSLSFTPTTDFDGTIVISIKKRTSSTSSPFRITDSLGKKSFEIRGSVGSLYNTFIGIGAGAYNLTGYFNVGIGLNCFLYNTTGYHNTAIGFQPLVNNTTGYRNVGIGSSCLAANISGSDNLGIGHSSLSSNITGQGNVGMGAQALISNTTGSHNIGIGNAPLLFNTTGSYNIGIGYLSGDYTAASALNATSTYSLYIGSSTRSSADGNTNEIVIGSSAYGNGSNTVTLGNTSVTGWYMGATKLIGVQGAAVANATDATTVIARLNDLLSRLRTHGLIAT